MRHWECQALNKRDTRKGEKSECYPWRRCYFWPFYLLPAELRLLIFEFAVLDFHTQFIVRGSINTSTPLQDLPLHRAEPPGLLLFFRHSTNQTGLRTSPELTRYSLLDRMWSDLKGFQLVCDDLTSLMVPVRQKMSGRLSLTKSWEVPRESTIFIDNYHEYLDLTLNTFRSDPLFGFPLLGNPRPDMYGPCGYWYPLVKHLAITVRDLESIGLGLCRRCYGVTHCKTRFSSLQTLTVYEYRDGKIDISRKKVYGQEEMKEIRA